MDWFFMTDANEVKGPFTGTEIERMGLPRDTLVSNDRSKWKPLFKIDFTGHIQHELQTQLDSMQAGSLSPAAAANQEGDGNDDTAFGCGIPVMAMLTIGAFVAVISTTVPSMWGVAFGVWIACTGLGMFLAKQTGMDSGKGGVLGFLLGPIGLLIIVVAWAVRGQTQESKTQDTR